MIPTSLNLRQDQIDKVTKWRHSLENDEGEDCSCASDVTFKLYSTGLGDVIYAECQGQKCHLTIDDDGILMD